MKGFLLDQNLPARLAFVPSLPLGRVYDINRASVREKECSAKAAEVEASQRLVPPRTTLAQCAFSLHS